MRTIGVSTEVFAKIWSLRQPGEETEDSILGRVLGCGSQPNRQSDRSTRESERKGFRDRRFDVHFEEGFEIFRNYLGTDFKARAVAGRWVLVNTGRDYVTLNELSRAIGAKTENAWVNWFFAAPNGERRPISDLRNPNKIRSRKRTLVPDTIPLRDL